jgi:peptidoglycan hydrolase-like protein with peptidoglycan-binding domain
MCMHYEDSWRARSNTAYTRDMRDKIALALVLANAGTVGDPQLSRGSSNSVAVRELQRLLNENGANPQLAVDGGFGPLTETAVRQFQILVALPSNGIVDQATWDALRNDKKGITDVEEEEMRTIYNRVEQVPAWARPTIARLVNANIMKGINSAGDLNLNDDLIRLMVLNERLGVMDHLPPAPAN